MLNSTVSRLLLAFDRQLLLAELVQDLPWTYDIQKGVLSFGDQFHWKAEVLGTESEETNTWLWSWANETSKIPPEQQAASLKLKALGEQHGIAEFTEPMVPLDHADGHAFASIAVGKGLGKAYYRGPYEGGAAFLLFTDEQIQFNVDDPLRRIITVFPQAISAMELSDHREALRGYLEFYGFEPQEDDGSLVVIQNDQQVLRAEFDEHRRLKELKGTLGQPSPK